MSIVHDSTTGSALQPAFVPTGTGQVRKLHRIETVRQQQGVSLRSVSRQMGRTMSSVRAQENEYEDLRVSDLLEWQKVLGVPIQDLLEEGEPGLSRPVMERAQLVRVMKTAAALLDTVESEGAKRMATMLIDQLVQIMPELADVSAWHSVGQRRSMEEYGRVVERSISDDFFGRD